MNSLTYTTCLFPDNENKFFGLSCFLAKKGADYSTTHGMLYNSTTISIKKLK